jgi:hypothetical protein
MFMSRECRVKENPVPTPIRKEIKMQTTKTTTKAKANNSHALSFFMNFYSPSLLS